MSRAIRSAPGRRKRLLFLSNLFPDERQPVFGLDNANVLHGLSEDWDISVIALRPSLKAYLPLRGTLPYLPRKEDEALTPSFLRVPYIPKFGDRWNHRLYADSIRPVLKRARSREEDAPDVILCSWLYPDATALVQAFEPSPPSSRSHPPVVLIAQGSDVHQYLLRPIRKRLILNTIASTRVRAVVTRSRNLADQLQSAGAPPGKLHPIYNGVAPEFFREIPQLAAREQLDLPVQGLICLFVGNLLPVKNPLFLIEAFEEAFRDVSPPAQLLMIGSGPLRAAIEQRVRDRGLGDRVHLLGSLPPQTVALYFRAADLFCLSSWNEGFPNVILEAMASRRPIVSTSVGGIPELINCAQLGTLVPPGDLSAYAAALRRALDAPADADLETRIREASPDLSRTTATLAYHRLLESALA